CGLHHFSEPPVLRLRQRTRLDDADDVADVRLILRVVRVELDAAADDLLVLRVRLHRVDLDDDGLVHRARDDHAAALLALASLGYRLRKPRDRLALGRTLALRLRALAPLRARKPLPLLLRGGLIGGTSRFPRSPLPWSAVADRLLRSRRRSFLLLCRRLGRRLRLVGRIRLRGGRLGRGLLCSRRLFGCRCLFGRGLFRRRSLFDLFGVLVLGLAHFFSNLASRSFRTVRMRAISRFASLRRALFSSAPVTDWKRRLNSSCLRSASAFSSSSSVMSLRSLAFKEIRLP